MPNPASMNVSTAVTGSQGGTSGSTSNGKTQSAGVVPFVRASQLYREGPFYDVSKQLTSSTQASGSVEIPAYGYARSILLVVTATGGAGTSVQFNEDGPFAALSDIYLSEPNGATIVQFNRGYHLYLSNKWGGYGYGDPKQDWSYSTGTATDGNFSFMIRVPIQINERDALGALPNQNAAAAFKLRFNLQTLSTIYSTAPGTTAPTVNVKAYLEAWDQPDVSTGGVANQTTPPAMNTTQFWSEQEFDSSGGQQKIRLTRVGNYIRNLIFVVRRGNTSRANGQTDWPDPITLYWDTRPLDIIGKTVWGNQMRTRSSYNVATADAAGGQDNGVFVYDFCHEFDGKLGYENRDLWLPTLSSTRLEIQGAFAAQADHITVLTNDVSTAGNVFL